MTYLENQIPEPPPHLEETWTRTLDPSGLAGFSVLGLVRPRGETEALYRRYDMDRCVVDTAAEYQHRGEKFFDELEIAFADVTKYVGREKEGKGFNIRGVNQMDKTLSVRGARISFSLWEVAGGDSSHDHIPLACKDSEAFIGTKLLYFPETLLHGRKDDELKIFEHFDGPIMKGYCSFPHGYMCPEYAMHGLYSMRLDVFSFGVLVLEIISGKKSSSFYQSDRGEHLLSHAWKLWKDGTPLEFMDPTLAATYSRNEVVRCIHIGLLCIQQDAGMRPSMVTIVQVLSNYTISLPLLEQPPFFFQSTTESCTRKSEECTSQPGMVSVDEASITQNLCGRVNATSFCGTPNPMTRQTGLLSSSILKSLL
ncbi:hypothetical protein LguiA_002523 [Lonicera macranthoides]